MSGSCPNFKGWSPNIENDFSIPVGLLTGAVGAL